MPPWAVLHSWATSALVTSAAFTSCSAWPEFSGIQITGSGVQWRKSRFVTQDVKRCETAFLLCVLCLPDSVSPSRLSFPIFPTLSGEKLHYYYFFKLWSLYVGVVVFPFLGFENSGEKKPSEAVAPGPLPPLPSSYCPGARGAPSWAHRQAWASRLPAVRPARIPREDFEGRPVNRPASSGATGEGLT